ncbi:hypothetical protein PR048_030301 [Dryococelus australis]|uniref:Uncharacterized protein n=1 Tax=Dryococelus australis TaxID=614101 RepID=A0ABQ9G8L6_9NEOP|nr:hypothetical protein PR048_030301 [Dryococelus australis]
MPLAGGFSRGTPASPRPRVPFHAMPGDDGRLRVPTGKPVTRPGGSELLVPVSAVEVPVRRCSDQPGSYFTGTLTEHLAMRQARSRANSITRSAREGEGRFPSTHPNPQPLSRRPLEGPPYHGVVPAICEDLPPAITEIIGCSPLDSAKRVRFPEGTLQSFRTWESCWTMPLVAGFLEDLRFSRPCVLTLLPPYALTSPSSPLKEPMSGNIQFPCYSHFKTGILHITVQNTCPHIDRNSVLETVPFGGVKDVVVANAEPPRLCWEQHPLYAQLFAYSLTGSVQRDAVQPLPIREYRVSLEHHSRSCRRRSYLVLGTVAYLRQKGYAMVSHVVDNALDTADELLFHYLQLSIHKDHACVFRKHVLNHVNRRHKGRLDVACHQAWSQTLVVLHTNESGKGNPRLEIEETRRARYIEEKKRPEADDSEGGKLSARRRVIEYAWRTGDQGRYHGNQSRHYTMHAAVLSPFVRASAGSMMTIELSSQNVHARVFCSVRRGMAPPLVGMCAAWHRKGGLPTAKRVSKTGRGKEGGAKSDRRVAPLLPRPWRGKSLPLIVSPGHDFRKMCSRLHSIPCPITTASGPIYQGDSCKAGRIDGRRIVVNRFQLTDEKTDDFRTDDGCEGLLRFPLGSTVVTGSCCVHRECATVMADWSDELNIGFVEFSQIITCSRPPVAQSVGEPPIWGEKSSGFESRARHRCYPQLGSNARSELKIYQGGAGSRTHDPSTMERDPRVERSWNARVGGGKRKCPEKTLRQAASPSTIPTFENPGVDPPGIELGSP